MSLNGAPLEAPVTFGGRALEAVQQYKYLGVEFTQAGSWESMVKSMLAKFATRKAALVRMGAADTKGYSIDTNRRLWRVLVFSAIKYGAEVWQPTKAQFKKLEQAQAQFGRYILGLRQTAQWTAVIAELNWMTVKAQFDQIKLFYFYRLTHLPEEHFARKVFTLRSNHAFQTGVAKILDSNINRAKTSLIRTLVKLMNKYKVEMTKAFEMKEEEWKIYIKSLVMEKDRIRIQKRLDASNYAPIAQQLIRSPFLLSAQATHHHQLSNIVAARVYAKLRTGAHSLEINTLRAVKQLPREERFCLQCKVAVGDENHFCLDCPALAHERALAFHSIEKAISSLQGGVQLWQWFLSKAGERSTQTLALLGMLPVSLTNMKLTETWYIAACRGINLMYQKKLRLNSITPQR
jgi:hypothetical protein